MRLMIVFLTLLCVSTMTSNLVQAQATLGAPYVIVEGSQLHTNQIFGAGPSKLLDEVDAAAKRLAGRVVKLHITAKDNAAVDAAAAEIKQRYAQSLPAVTVVVGKLFDTEATLGIDAVIAFKGSPKEGVRVEEDSFGRILHPGARVYVSGQAEKDKTNAGAVIGTMQSLSNSLEAVNAKPDDIVQVKVFLNPIRTEKRVRSEIQQFLGDRKIPVVCVEWSSTLPVEIELVAACPAGVVKSGIEYLTPPTMTTSPLYARMAKLNGKDTIYIGGLTARGTEALSGEDEVKDIFASLRDILKETGSDYENLVKATYYCANEDTSKALNTLRPNYYNPTRPPAASKAIVGGVGRDKRFLTVDMIAAPR